MSIERRAGRAEERDVARRLVKSAFDEGDEVGEQELREIEARLAMATPGPWEVGKNLGARSHEWIISRDVGQGRGLVLFDTRAGAPESELDNARFIAHAPTDVAALLAEVKALRAENERLKAVTIITCQWCGKAEHLPADRTSEDVKRVVQTMKDHERRCQSNPLAVALNDISSVEFLKKAHGDGDDGCEWCEGAILIARKALGVE